MIRVLIADDTTLFRQGLRSLLRYRGEVQLVGEATCAEEIVDLVTRLCPDVLLLDQDLPGLAAADTVRLVKERVPRMEVIVLAERGDEEAALQLLGAGATGYVLKDISDENLVRAIESVCNGRTLMNPRVTRQLVERFRQLMDEKSRRDGQHMSGLTTRELEILLEMTKGATDREIAQKMYLSTTTIKSHIRGIFRKIGVRNRTQAVVHVLRSGLVR